MKFDPKVTQAIQDWLNTAPEQRDIKAGADLMLSLNRNRALYNSILRRPDKFVPKLVYELKKHLRLRLDQKAVADVVRMEPGVMASAASLIETTAEISVDDDLPEGVVAHGRRSDHDALPAEIRELWDSNAERYQQIKLLFNELKAMHDAQPCDRYEKLVILDSLDKKYRSNLEQYDNFVLSSQSATEEAEAPVATAPEVSTDNEKTVNNARKTLSKYRKILSEVGPDDPKRLTALDKIQQAVSAILACGAGVADDTKAELVALGIKFD